MITADLQAQLIQAEAAVRVATRKVSGNIWPAHKLQEAQSNLNAIKIRINELSKKTSSQSGVIHQDTLSVITSSEKKSLDQSVTQRLIQSAQASSRKLAELSNLLHCTTGAEKVALLRTIGIETLKKEKSWSKYYYYKRNGKEEQETEIDPKSKQEATVSTATFELLQLEKEKDLLMQSRSRYKKRLETEPLTEKSRIKLEESYYSTDMQVKALQQRIAALKF
jgi:hypothetical protein